MAKRHLRQRSTAVVVRDGRVLLVRDRGKRRFSLPGGAIKRKEPVVGAAARELYEELGLEAIRIVRLPECDFDGSANEHRVCLIEADGEPMLRRLEIADFIWWDTKEPIPVFAHVKAILRKTGLLRAVSRSSGLIPNGFLYIP